MKEEALLQIACVEWLQYQYPRAFFMHCPSGAKMNWKSINMFKRMGWRSGCPDLLIFNKVGFFSGLAIEFKTSKGRVSDEQNYFQGILAVNDWSVKVCNSFDSFTQCVENYFKGNL